MFSYRFFREHTQALLHRPVPTLLSLCGVGLLVAAGLTWLNVRFGWALQFKSGASFIALPREMGGAILLGLAGLLFLGAAWCVAHARTLWAHKGRTVLAAVLLVAGGYGAWRVAYTHLMGGALFVAAEHNDAAGFTAAMRDTPPDAATRQQLLNSALRTGSLAVADQLLAAGADLNMPVGEFNWTPLMDACVRYSLATVRYLLAHGADANARDQFGRTPLILTVLYREQATPAERAAVLRVLLDHSADPTLADADGRTARDYATERGDAASAAVLR